MGTIRLGKRTEGRSPKINDVVPLAGARRSRVRRLGHLRRRLLRRGENRRRARAVAARAGSARAREDPPVAGRVRSALREAARRPERQEGQEQEGSRRAGDRRHPRVQGRQQPRSPGDGLVRQHRDLHDRDRRRTRRSRASNAALEAERSGDSVEHGLRVRGDPRGDSVRERGAEPHGRHSRAGRAGGADAVAARRQGSEDRADADQDDHRAGPQGAAARRRRAGTRPTSSATATAKCSTIRSRSRRRKRARSRCSTTSSSRSSIPISTRISATSCGSTTIRRAATTRKAGTTSIWSAGSATRCS